MGTGMGVLCPEEGFGGCSTLFSAAKPEGDPAFLCTPGEGWCCQHGIAEAGLGSSPPAKSVPGWGHSEKAKSTLTSQSGRV